MVASRPMGTPSPARLTASEPAAATPSEKARGDLLFGAALLGVTACAVALVVLLRAVAIPVLIGAAAAYTLEPAVAWLERRGWTRTAAAVLIGLVLTALGVAFLAFVLPALVGELSRVPEELRELSRRGLPRLPGRFSVLLPHWVADPYELLTSRTARAAGRLMPALAGLLEVATGKALSVLTGFLVAPIVAFYLMRDAHRLLRYATELVPPGLRDTVVGHLAEVDEVMAGFIRGQLTVGTLLSLLYFAALSLSGLHLALLVGVVTGLGNLIPYVGLVSGLSLSVMLAVLHWEGPAILMKIALCYGGLSLLESTVLGPRLVGHRVGLPAAGVVVAILAFGALFGFAGILVAVPATALLKVAFRSLLRAYRASPWYA